MRTTLTLSVPRFVDTTRWRWRLTNDAGHVLAEHDVAIDQAAPEYAAWVDLAGYLRVRAAPDTRDDDEERLVAQVGSWIEREVLGPITQYLIDVGGPVTVRVSSSSDSLGITSLVDRPLQLATFQGRPLSLQHVTFVAESGAGITSRQPGRTERDFRMLGLFSAPASEAPLGLRQERRELQKLFASLAAARAVACRFVQYGVTLESLERLLRDGEGWDVVHVSGHGEPGRLLLEGRHGTSAPISSLQLVEVLRGTAARLKLVVLSSCSSGVEELEDTRATLKIEPALWRDRDRSASSKDRSPSVARAIASEFDCAVVAMRYPVEDRFAASFTKHLYAEMLTGECSLPDAFEAALEASTQTTFAPAIAAGTPALSGSAAATLTLSLPSAGPEIAVRPTLPDVDPLFVGRGRVMTEASTAFVPGSGVAGLLLIGMAGIGKTACAKELVDLQWGSGRFDGFLSYTAPRLGLDVGDEMNRFAQCWEPSGAEAWRPRVPMVGLLDPAAPSFERVLTQLRGVLEKRSLLIWLDNLESLLQPDGRWRLEAFGRVVSVLLSHRGSSRTIMTSRVRPVFPVTEDRPTHVRQLSLNALTLDESLALARELPNLGALLRSRSATRSEREGNRAIVREVLRMVQGHPKLMQMADAIAADPQLLRGRLERVSTLSSSAALDTFMTSGTTALDETDVLATLRVWTHDVLASLSTDVRDGFAMLCCLEDDDRRGSVADDLWHQSDLRSDASVSSGSLAQLARQLESVGLVEVRRDGGDSVYYLHPGVAEIGMSALSTDVRKAIEQTVADQWRSRYEAGLKQESDIDNPESSARVVEYALRAIPYLLRLEDWGVAADMIEEVRCRDESPAINERLLADLGRVILHGEPRRGRNLRILGSVQLNAGMFDAAAETLERATEQCIAAGNYKEASVALDERIDMLYKRGRIDEAMRCLDEMKASTRKAGLGPWSRLVDDTWELLLWHAQGRHAEVLERFDRELYPAMDRLEEHTQDPTDPADSWTAREHLLDVARRAATSLGDWSRALKLIGQAADSQRRRNAPPMEVAEVRLNAYRPLIELGRLDEAAALVDECRTEFERGESIRLIGEALAAVADLDAARGDHHAAAAEAASALRYRYIEMQPDTCADGHLRLALHLAHAGEDPSAVGAHRLAAALIRYRTWPGDDARLADAIASLLGPLAGFARQPRDYADLCNIVERTEGVRFRNLFDDLPGRRETDGQRVYELVMTVLSTGGLRVLPGDSTTAV